MIVVTGANGRYGRAVVDGLLRHVSAERIGVSVRDPEKAADLARLGVRVARGEYADPASLAAAFAGAEQVLIVSSTETGDEGVRQHGNAFAAAASAGVRRILYTSHQAASASSAISFARHHAATEALLRSSGVPFVSLRNGFYAESALYQLRGIQRDGRLALPADGPVSWTARADLAEAGVAALLDRDLFADGISPPLTASRSLVFSDVARLASEILGRDVPRIVVDDAAYRDEQRAFGYPDAMIEMLLSAFAAMRAGEFDVVDPTLARILGREPTPMRDTLRGFLAGSSAG